MCFMRDLCNPTWCDFHVGSCQVEEALGFLHSAGLSEAAKFAAGTVLCCVDEAQKIPPALEREAELVLLRVTEVWQKLVSLPPGAASLPVHEWIRDCLSLAFVRLLILLHDSLKSQSLGCHHEARLAL